MKVTFLGTGTSQGVPIIACQCHVCQSLDQKDKRLRSSVMVEIDGKVLVIDSGPDFRQQMLRENVQQLDALIFTHSHKDHIAGMDDIRAFNYKFNTPVDVYADALVQRAMHREFPYVFDPVKYPGVPEINLHEIGATPFIAAGIEVIPIEVMHMRLPVKGFRIKDFCYITDANYIAEDEKAKILGSKVLVLNALRNEMHPSHFTLGEALELANELEVPQVYFTHISHQLGLHKTVEDSLPKGRNLAYDGLSLTF